MDDAQLIEQVQGFPTLYNKTDKRYKLRTIKEQAWLSIGSILGFPAETCKQRWTVLRAKYTKLRKEIRDKPSGSGSYTISWPFYEIMGFLDPYLTTRKTISNISKTQDALGSPLSPAWDTLSQMTNNDEALRESDVQMEDSEMSQDSDLPRSSDTSRPASALSKATLVGEKEESLPSVTPKIPKVHQQEFRAKMANLRKGIEGVNRGKKNSAQESMCNSITEAVKEFSNKKVEEDKGGNLSWARSLAIDMEVLSPTEKIVFKSRVYSLLDDHL